MKILTIANKKEEKFLRQKTAEFDFKTYATTAGEKFTRKQIEKLIKNMKITMEKAPGIGLSANQVGLNLKLFVAQIPETRLEKNGKEISTKATEFYVIFNPEIKNFSKRKTIMEEGCLSVPGIFGEVERPEKITLSGFNKKGKKITLEAEGLLAKVFQHETDHLNGILFIDKAKNLKKL
ncbi:MAG: peptide deformylase [Patescibacteria group bacterium]